MQDLILTEEFTELEFAGPENDGLEFGRLENDRLENRLQVVKWHGTWLRRVHKELTVVKDDSE